MKYQSPDPQKVNLIAQLPYLQKNKQNKTPFKYKWWIFSYELKKKKHFSMTKFCIVLFLPNGWLKGDVFL